MIDGKPAETFLLSFVQRYVRRQRTGMATALKTDVYARTRM